MTYETTQKGSSQNGKKQNKKNVCFQNKRVEAISCKLLSHVSPVLATHFAPTLTSLNGLHLKMHAVVYRSFSSNILASIRLASLLARIIGWRTRAFCADFLLDVTLGGLVDSLSTVTLNYPQ